jgi:hypothetical protein
MGEVLDAISYFIGAVIAAVIDIVVFGAIVAIPLAALVYLTVISQGTAMVVLMIVAGIAALRVAIVSALKAL